jgi:hypothetical protein
MGLKNCIIYVDIYIYIRLSVQYRGLLISVGWLDFEILLVDQF